MNFFNQTLMFKNKWYSYEFPAISCYLDPLHEVMKRILILPNETDPSGSGSKTLIKYVNFWAEDPGFIADPVPD